MPQYEMPFGSVEAERRFDALDTFTQGYVEAALWCGLDEEDEVAHFDGPSTVPFDALAPETLAGMVEDCHDFQDERLSLLEQWGDDHQAGVDFWLTRNEHGAGFWDRGRGELGDELTKWAQTYGPVALYVGDDGMIYAA